MTKFICETKNLSKKYKDFYALKNVNLTIPKGEIYGLVGENGAGKTTLIRLLTGLNFKSEGEIILFGHKDNLQHERSKIGCTIEMPALYKDMTASQNLEVQRIQRGIPNKKCITDTLELIGLSNAGKKRVANFSLGMKQRLALGVALLGEPEFLILDEPVNGLDPTGIIELRELLKKLVKEREVTILISSHILSELHQLATCYGFLHKGELLKQISAEELNEECKRHICLRTDNIQKTTLLLEQKGNINNYSVYPDNSIRIYECLDNVRMISKLLSSNGVIIDEISVQGENLETYFENLIGDEKMFNQIRAEFYKLFHTKALYLTFALILAVFGIFSIGGQQQFVASSSSLDETWKIGETVGFLARAYSDTAHPLIEEIIRTATSYTVFFWLIVLIFSVIFFSREYTDSTIKIAIASGQSRIKFFVAKYIVISITSIFLYFSFIMIAFIIECAKFNIPIQLFPMLKIAGLNCMIMGAFIGITLMLCVIFKHTAIVVGAMSLFTFSGPLIYMMTWDNMSTQSWRVLTYLKINPMYYWMNTCSYNMINNLEINILIYFVGTVIITFLVSALILRKQEIR